MHLFLWDWRDLLSAGLLLVLCLERRMRSTDGIGKSALFQTWPRPCEAASFHTIVINYSILGVASFSTASQLWKSQSIDCNTLQLCISTKQYPWALHFDWGFCESFQPAVAIVHITLQSLPEAVQVDIGFVGSKSFFLGSCSLVASQIGRWVLQGISFASSWEFSFRQPLGFLSVPYVFKTCMQLPFGVFWTYTENYKLHYIHCQSLFSISAQVLHSFQK